MIENLLAQIDDAFLREACSVDESTRFLVQEFLDALEQGCIRAAFRSSSGYQVDERVKKGILLAFRIGQKEKINVGPFTYIDKDNLWPRRFDINDGPRIVPGGVSIRRGAYIGRNVTVMPPSYINVGAFVDDDSLIDSNVLVGSCAQIGKRTHISAGAQIGGVLEPIGALPVIIEDDVLIGGNCGIYEGCEIKSHAVLGAGVILTKSTKVFDLVNESVLSADEHRLKIPENAVLIPGARMLSSDFARRYELSVSTPLIIKYRDEKTNKKTLLEDLLR